ncbi:glycosyltransferase family 61 protein [Methylobacterium sp.]|uniref:glycosyltransferase family 61 protein n=1 Tax=Methylobacterium sp. TaxID=409 RepID=UPI00257CA86D|nr:glycosyltransferase family 61 protein [Methylobacterium sp.]
MIGRYPDIAASGIDPVSFFAEHWHQEPLRSPSPAAERAIFALSPLVVLALHLASRDRQDWLDCLRKRIIDLSCTDRNMQHGLALRIARFVGERLQRAPARMKGLHGGGLGRTMPVLNVGQGGAPNFPAQVVETAGTYTFREPQDIDEAREPVTRRVERPALWCATVPDASVFGFFQVASGGSLIRYEPAADPMYRFVARQAEFVIHCYPKRRRAVLARIPAVPDATVDEAVLLGGRCGANYYHFLIEYLTRGRIIEEIPQLDGLPLIVSEEMFPQEYDALRIALPGRTLIPRAHASRLDVRQLHIPSIMTDLPDSAEVPLWKVAAVNQGSLKWLRERILAHPEVQESQEKFPARLFLSRTGARNITNAPEVEQVFTDFGFSIIDTAAYSFTDQAKIFASATVIAGAMGAAFSNLIFAKPSAHAYVLASPHLVRFPIFASLATFAGCDYQVIAGYKAGFRARMADDRQALSVTHSEFAVDTTKLRRVLENAQATWM